MLSSRSCGIEACARDKDARGGLKRAAFRMRAGVNFYGGINTISVVKRERRRGECSCAEEVYKL